MVSVESIDALLPQTQCQRCGYQDCRAYAQAIKEGTPHNQCPPGGDTTLKALEKHLQRKPLALNTDCGTYQPKQLAVIDEASCIGCTKCLPACPVDAIIGSGKKMHTVLTDECTGCVLCLPPCPVDCITLIPAKNPTYDTEKARKRHQFHDQRLGFAPPSSVPLAQIDNDAHTMRHYIQQATQRVRKKKQGPSE